MSKKFLLFLFVGFSVLSSINHVWAFDKTENALYSSQKFKNICLIYNGSTFRRQWNVNDFIPYLVYEDGEKNYIPLFDTFLLIEYRTSDGKFFWGGQDKENTVNIKDWEWLSNVWESCMKHLNEAVKKLHQKGILKNSIGIIITIPEPNVKIQDFGSIPDDGIKLNFNKEIDRMLAVRWYVEKIVAHFSSSHYSYLNLLGFYWLGESIPQEMENTVKETAKLIHQENLLFFWIPYFTANNVWAWRDLGFDYVFYQPNYFFSGEGGIERLGLTAYRVEKFNCGVEIELDDQVMVSENHRVRFLQYLQSAVYFGWDKKPMAWYQSNDTILKLYRSDNEKHKNLYRDIAHFFRGTYQPLLNLPPIPEYRVPPREGKNWSHRDNGTKVIEPSSGFCLSQNPEWAIDGDVDFYSGTSGFACCSIPGEIKIQFADNVVLSRVQMLLFNLDNRYYQYRVEISEDNRNWKTVVDKSQGEHRGWQIDTFPSQPTRYLRIIPLFNSTGQYLFQLVELEVY